MGLDSISLRELPALSPLPATRALADGLLARWLDEHHAVFWETAKHDVVSVDVRTGGRETLSDYIDAMLVVADGRWAIPDDRGNLYVHDASGKRLWEHSANARLRALSMTKHGLFFSTGGLVRLLDPKGATVWEQKREASSIAASADGRWLAVRQLDDPIVVLRASDGSEQKVLDGVVCEMEFSPDGTKLAVAITALDARVRHPRGPTVVYDTGTWRPLLRIGGRGGCGGLAFSPDGKKLAVHGDESLSIWELASGEAVAWTVSTGSLAAWGPAGILLQQTEVAPTRGRIVFLPR